MRGIVLISKCVTDMLGLTNAAASYVIMAPAESVSYLTQEDGEMYGIEFTRMNVPAYNPLP